MKVCFLVAKNILQGGGIERYTREVGRRLVTRGHDVVVYSTSGCDRTPDIWEGLKLRWVPRVQPHWAEKVAGSIHSAALAAAFGPHPDVYHLHSVAAGAMAPLLRMRQIPCILQMHGVEWQRSRWGTVARSTLRLLEKVSFASATVVTAVSRAQCEFYQRLYRTPVSFIPAGTALKDPVPPTHLAQLGIAPSEYFLTAVRLVREKGVHYLINAFRKVASDWKLIIAGCSDDRAYLEFLRGLAAGDDRIQFLGHVESPLLDELYCHAGAYIQASELEGMAISILDAMSFGRCCIASEIHENRDILADTGIYFRSTDSDDLALQMAKVEQSAALAATLGERARARAVRYFSWDAVTENLESLYLATCNRQ